jgi:hypothetical protein
MIAKVVSAAQVLRCPHPAHQQSLQRRRQDRDDHTPEHRSPEGQQDHAEGQRDDHQQQHEAARLETGGRFRGRKIHGGGRCSGEACDGSGPARLCPVTGQARRVFAAGRARR